jgi:hypothetical protein
MAGSHMQNLLHNISLSDHPTKDCVVVGQTCDVHGEIIHSLTFLEADFIELHLELLIVHLPHPLHTDAMRFDRLPDRLGGVLGFERCEHLLRHSSENGS